MFSLIIPIGPHDDDFTFLLKNLADLYSNAPFDFECLLVGTTPMPSRYEELLKKIGKTFKLQWIKSLQGRALQMNVGAETAEGDFFWFVHGDSRLDRRCLSALVSSIKHKPQALHYFKLGFLSDGPALVFMNALFANWRADILGIPFGDQGFCLHREMFFKLGGFDPDARHEDHHLVWKIHSASMELTKVDALLQTSARKYRRKGWLYTTIMHLYMTYEYAIPRWWHLVKKRYK